LPDNAAGRVSFEITVPKALDPLLGVVVSDNLLRTGGLGSSQALIQGLAAGVPLAPTTPASGLTVQVPTDRAPRRAHRLTDVPIG
jgi:hypothetical protein